MEPSAAGFVIQLCSTSIESECVQFLLFSRFCVTCVCIRESVSLLLSRADSRVHVFVILVCVLAPVHMCWCMYVCVVCDCISCSLPGAVFFVTVAMLGLNVWGALIIIAVVFMILVNMGGAMALFGITPNAVSLVNLVMVSG